MGLLEDPLAVALSLLGGRGHSLAPHLGAGAADRHLLSGALPQW